MPKEFSLSALVVTSFTAHKEQAVIGHSKFFSKGCGKNGVLHCSEWILVILKFNCEAEVCAGKPHTAVWGELIS